MPKEYYLIERITTGLRPIFNAIFSRTATAKHAIPVMNKSIGNIIHDAKVLEAAMGHVTEAYSDSQEISDKFAHLVTFAINLPESFRGDGGFWSYALNLVEEGTFRDGLMGNKAKDIKSVSLDKLGDLYGIMGEALIERIKGAVLRPFGEAQEEPWDEENISLEQIDMMISALVPVVAYLHEYREKAHDLD